MPLKAKAKKAKQAGKRRVGLKKEYMLSDDSASVPHSREDGLAIALSTAESYSTPALLQSLQVRGLLVSDSSSPATKGAVNLLGECIFIPRWSTSSLPQEGSSPETSETGEVFIFESGTIVTWGLSRAGAEAFLSTVIRNADQGGSSMAIEDEPYTESEMEMLKYWVVEDEMTSMYGDSIYLGATPAAASPDPLGLLSSTAPPDPELLARLAFSSGMARVTKLGVYERQFEDFSDRVGHIAGSLANGSEAPIKKKDIIKNVGTLHTFRQKLNLEDENLLEEPEFLWEDSRLETLYASVSDALEFEIRFDTLNKRVDYAFQLQDTLKDLLNTKTSHRLEWIIIILIAIEIGLALVREGLPRQHKRDTLTEADYRVA